MYFPIAFSVPEPGSLIQRPQFERPCDRDVCSGIYYQSDDGDINKDQILAKRKVHNSECFDEFMPSAKVVSLDDGDALVWGQGQWKWRSGLPTPGTCGGRVEADADGNVYCLQHNKKGKSYIARYSPDGAKQSVYAPRRGSLVDFQLDQRGALIVGLNEVDKQGHGQVLSIDLVSKEKTALWNQTPKMREFEVDSQAHSLAFVGNDAQVYLHSLDNSQTRCVSKLEEPLNSSPDWSGRAGLRFTPDGSRLLYNRQAFAYSLSRIENSGDLLVASVNSPQPQLAVLGGDLEAAEVFPSDVQFLQQPLPR